MFYDVLIVVLHMLGALAAAAILGLGFVFQISLGNANGQSRALFSRGVDSFAVVLVYLSWFGLLWWFGFRQSIFMTACGATVILCLIYAASYRAARHRGQEHAEAGEAPLPAGEAA